MKYFFSASAIIFHCLIFGQAPETAQSSTPVSSAAQNNGEFLNSAEAQQVAATTEAGKYERKSVSFVNVLWLMDPSVRRMPPEFIPVALEKINEGLTIERFDYNPLSEAVISDFVAKAGTEANLTDEAITRIIDETLVPKILRIVDLNKELRAQNYTTEAQRNSFYAIKAKEFGYTDVEIAKIMNSAYLYIPIAQNYWSRTSYMNFPFVRRHKVRMDLGALWYHISTKGEKAQAKLVYRTMTTLRATASGNDFLWFGNQTHKFNGKTVSAEEYTFRRGLKNAVRNLVVAAQDIPDFRLSGQVLDKDAVSVGFDLGNKEGIKVGDKYRLAEFEELPDGSIHEQYAGWVSVNKIAKVDDNTGYVSHATRITGDPSTGTVLSEYPRIPIDMVLKLVTFSGVRDTNNFQVFSGSLGMQLDARYNIGRRFNWPELFVAVGYAYGRTEKIGDYYKPIPFDDRTSYGSGGFGGFTFYLLQRYHFRRYSLGAEAGWAKPGLTAIGESVDGHFYKTLIGTGGWYGGGNLGAALHPAITIEAGLVYETGGIKDGDRPYIADHSGLRARLGVVYSPRSMPVDPADFLRGLFGF